MIQLTAEIKSKMKTMVRIHALLAVVSGALLAFSFFAGREQALFPFSVLLALNIVGIALLAFYKRKKAFP